MKVKKKPTISGLFKKRRVHLAILTPSSPGTTFAASELDFQVRDVTGYFLTAIDTPKSYYNLSRSFTITKQDKQALYKEPCSLHTKIPSGHYSEQENKAKRVISIGQLNILLCLHTQPIKLVVYKHP